MEPVIKPVFCTGSNDHYIYLGFCPDYVEVKSAGSQIMGWWHRALGNDAMLISTPDGTDGSEDVTKSQTDRGIKLADFGGKPATELSNDPAVVTDPNDADGIILTSNFGSASTGMSSGDVMWLMADVRSNGFVRAVHDGGSVVYLQDTNIDFKEAGVSGDQQWIALNITQGNYAYVGDVQHPHGEWRANKVILTDSGGTAITTNQANSDVVWLMPKEEMQYPLSDIGLFS